MKKYSAELFLLLNTLMWGVTFVIIKNALSEASPMVFVAARFLLATVIILPFIAKIFKDFNKNIFISGVILGVLYFIGFATQTAGLYYTSATKSGFITGTFVIFTPIFQLIIERKIPSKWNIVGIFLVVAGLILLSSKGTSFFDIFSEIGENFNFGDFLTLLCAIFFALYLVYLDIATKNHPYLPLVFFQISVTGIGGLLMVFLFYTLKLETPFISLTGNVIFALVYTALFATTLATFIQTKYQKFVTPTKAGIIFSFEPIFAAVFAFFMIDERLSSFGFIGCILIFTGLLVSEIFDKNKGTA